MRAVIIIFIVLETELFSFTIGVGYNFDADNFEAEHFKRCAEIGVDDKIHSNEQRTVQCDEPVWGRYVALYVPNTRQMALSVCELEVYGFDTCSE